MIEGPVRGTQRIPEGVKPFPPTGYRQLDARTSFFYGITGITPAMAMRLTGIGSQYLFSSMDADKNYFDGSKSYKCTLPKGIPAVKFWSFTLYDNQTRSMLDTPQRHPRAGSQSYSSPCRSRPRWLDRHLLRPDAAARRSARQLDSNRPEERMVRDPSPLQPTRTVFLQGMASERDPAGPVAHDPANEDLHVRLWPSWRHARCPLLAQTGHSDGHAQSLLLTHCGHWQCFVANRGVG
jgi:hypothetical protein